MDTPLNPALPDFVHHLARAPLVAPWHLGLAPQPAALRRDANGSERGTLVKKALVAVAAAAGPAWHGRMLGLLDAPPLIKVGREATLRAQGSPCDGLGSGHHGQDVGVK
jgi:hypothetical protein